MKYLLFLILGLPQLTWACICIAPKRPPTAASVRTEIEAYFESYQSVLRVRTVKAVSVAGLAKFEFQVIGAWKGPYKTGDILVVPSVEMFCDSTVGPGDELLVGFNSVADANFTKGACPERFPRARRSLEDNYLRVFSRRYKRTLPPPAG